MGHLCFQWLKCYINMKTLIISLKQNEIEIWNDWCRNCVNFFGDLDGIFFPWIFNMTFPKPPEKSSCQGLSDPYRDVLLEVNCREKIILGHPWLCFPKTKALVKLKQNLWTAAVNWTNTVIKCCFVQSFVICEGFFNCKSSSTLWCLVIHH